MRVFRNLLPSCLLWLGYTSNLFAEAVEVSYPNSITLSYEVIGSKQSSAKPLGTIAYDATTLKYNLKSWTPPTTDHLKSTTPEPTTSQLLRILLPDGSSTVASLDTFDESLYQKIDLFLSADGKVFSAAISPITPPALTPEEDEYRKKVERAKARGKPIPKRPKEEKPKKSKGKAKVEQPKPNYEPIRINLIRSSDAITPKLGSRKPPQVDAEGKEIPAAEEQPEKSFLQKYWWVFLIGIMLTMTAGGEK